MAHELRGLEHQSAEFYTQLFTAGLVFAAAPSVTARSAPDGCQAIPKDRNM